jgi:DNA-binding transcriptional regulator PaaX
MSQNETSRLDIQGIILKTVAAAGIIGIALVAPNVLGAIAGVQRRPYKRQSEVIKAAQKRLVAKGLLAYAGGYAKLTPKGERALQKFALKNYQIKKPRRWDGKWRVLIFDITERRRRTRDHMRQTLQRIGFIRLQDSVWIYPYDCQELVSLLKADMKIGKAMLYLVVEEMEGDRPYREYFHLLR